MKKFLLLIVAAIALAYLGTAPRGVYVPSYAPVAGINSASDQSLADAFSNSKSNVQVQGSGIVTKTLPDDTKGSRHQRFIVELASGQTLLVAHNIDIAERIDSLSVGDRIEFGGEYEWNPKGGVIHWTHHDPRGHHVAGWIKCDGHTYQ